MAKARVPKRPYHHGKLREALLEEAERILNKQGVDGLALREIARRVGVSHAAAYHHFEDRDGLVCALAARGFERLASDLAAGARRADGPAGFDEMGVAYVAFAARRPGMFRLMFGPEAAAGRADPELRANVDAAFSILLEGARTIVATPGDDRAVRCVALRAWSLVHGLASLLLDDQLSHHGLALRDHERIAREVLAARRLLL
jgi:AcrR family transcriptional regulator